MLSEHWGGGECPISSHFIYCYFNLVCAIRKQEGKCKKTEEEEPYARASSSAAVRPGSFAFRLFSSAYRLLGGRGWYATPGSTPTAFLSLQTSEPNQIRDWSLPSFRAGARSGLQQPVRPLGTAGSVLPLGLTEQMCFS